MTNDSCREGVLDFPCDVERLPNGNTLISDAGGDTGEGSEIIEVDSTGRRVWGYSEGLRFAHSAKRLANGNTLIADTTNNRIIEVTNQGKIVLSSDEWSGGSGKLSDGSHLHYPNDAHPLEDGAIIVTDRNNNRCVIVDRAGQVSWQYGGAKHPHNCDMLANGNVLIANSDADSILEVNRKKEIVWQYSSKSDPLRWPRDADRLGNGNTLITDSKNSRVIEVTPEGNIAWTFRVPYLANFYDADLLASGNILVSDQQHHQVLEVDRFGNIVWMFRNYRAPYPIHARLENGSFQEREADGLPSGWLAHVKTSEGGGRVIWDEEARPAPCPGVEDDRAGAFCLYQVIGVVPGGSYRLTGEIKTRIAPNAAVVFFQLAFLDGYGGLIHDVMQSPKGRMFAESSDWRPDAVEARAPAGATACEVRLFISGKGSAWMKNVDVQGPGA